MGEYITVDGEEIKAGTCEEMLYVRRDEMEQWVRDGRAAAIPGNAPPATLVAVADRLFWRFPWPWEDEHDVFAIREREPFTTGGTCGDFEPPDGIEIPHARITAHFQWKGGGGGVNVYVPCPATLKYAQGPLGERKRGSGVELCSKASPRIQVRSVGKGGATLFACSYCEVLFYLDAAELARLIGADTFSSMYAGDRYEPQREGRAAIVARLRPLASDAQEATR